MVPKQYIEGLTPSQRVLQEKLFRQSEDYFERTGKVKARPRVSAKESPRSPHVQRFEKKYGYKVTDLRRVRQDFPDTDIDTILRKGKGAYMTSGSRPNQTPDSWANARLASVLTGGSALKVDKDLVGSKSLEKIRS